MAAPSAALSLPADLQPLFSQIAHDYPEIVIKTGARFSYKPPRTVIFEPFSAKNSPYPPANFALLAFHELGHAVLGAKDYTTHVERLKIECEAWKCAKTLFEKYQKRGLLPAKYAWDEDFIEQQLDTYRDWLHAKSRCKTCGLTRYQTPDGRYHCPRCS